MSLPKKSVPPVKCIEAGCERAPWFEWFLVLVTVVTCLVGMWREREIAGLLAFTKTLTAHTYELHAEVARLENELQKAWTEPQFILFEGGEEGGNYECSFNVGAIRSAAIDDKCAELAKIYSHARNFP
jgi:hypothetical protein